MFQDNFSTDQGLSYREAASCRPIRYVSHPKFIDLEQAGQPLNRGRHARPRPPQRRTRKPLTFQYGKLHWRAAFRLGIDGTDVTMRELLARAFRATGLPATACKAAALVFVLVLGLAMPAQAHKGHEPRSTATAAAAKAPERLNARYEAASVAMPACAPEPAETLQGWATSRLPLSVADPTCCGTMCTVALLGHSAPSLPVPSARRIKQGLSPQTHALMDAPGPHARPPRTDAIA